MDRAKKWLSGQKTDHWSFRGGFTYLNEKNINNVPPLRTNYRKMETWKTAVG
ncbi:DUF560 domain-containing protein [Salmonella enterica]|uniref:DUF560 domain-containing protein n=1 Tax=Salmonella diarizonae TaxID=59204 RepID=A0A627X2A0_SALDZ|nr:DUF560 domain-containing protein [Salmonella enterica]ECE1088390.1 DUF560 domain-containing protein [Salmonella enterica subsp. diarizonae]EGE5261591.1 DUF560 domain-containing protein [Salmonella enterica subsp. diarizonae serovar 38:k:z]ECG8574991.1 DUF560 domain-containing protein [Salmonella enterica subsp. diarizonae]EDD0502179.1 DUF560 domain-containing protein [Salmonella enterica subsp. diarizonae]